MPAISQQVRNSNELVALRAQLIDHLRQGRNSLTAVASAIVKKIMFPSVAWLTTDSTISDARDLFARRLFPIMRIDFLPNNYIAHILRDGQLRNFFGVFRLVINPVRRTEQYRFHAKVLSIRRWVRLSSQRN